MNAAAAKLAAPIAAKRGWLRWPLVWTVLVCAVLVWGSRAHLERYITPHSGVGYWLGIVGGSMMILLLVYSARKRARWLHWLGNIPAWFRIHMTLGVMGPVLVLFHANFSLGATNSNVALFSMLLVAGSGVVGRYIYTRLHASMDDHEETLEQLKAVGERLRTQTSSMAFLPGLSEEIDRLEQWLIAPSRGQFGAVLSLVFAPYRMAMARYRVRRAINLAMGRAMQSDSPLLARHAPRIMEAARRYAYRRFDAGRRATEYKTYTRLFSYWHILHLPLFFLLLIAGFVHVIAINIY
jgi:hypothetical protein